MSNKGRAFEQLIYNLELLLARTPIEIRSPDFLIGKLSGVTREVDVSLRGKVGSVELLVIIECRDRKHKQDVRWIEQLSAKRDDVGAAKAIAVSQSGFSAASCSMASSLGIDIRSFADIDEQEISRWICFNKVVFVVHILDQIYLGFDDFSPRDQRQEIISMPGKIENYSEQKLASLVITNASDGMAVSPLDILNKLRRNGDLIPPKPVSRYNEISVMVRNPRDGYCIQTDDGRTAYLTNVSIAGDFTAGLAALPPGRSIQYRNGEAALSFGAEVTVNGPQGPISVRAHASADKSRYHIVVQSENEIKEIYLDNPRCN
jgi:hypothetical protein